MSKAVIRHIANSAVLELVGIGTLEANAISSVFLSLAAGAMIITALAHSILGEMRLIQPILASDIALMRRPLARRVVRYAWHLTSVLWFVLTYFLLRPVWNGAPLDREFILVVGAAHLLVGVFDAIATRGQHVGWPLLTATGVFALAAVASGG